mgnify:CR=1 FL=1
MNWTYSVIQPSPLLIHTVDRVVYGLRQTGQLEMSAENHDDVVQFCATHMAQATLGSQLVETLSIALVMCEHVEELYADNEEIKALITAVGEL